MFELTLSTTIDRQVYLSRVYSKLDGEIRQDAGVVTKQNNNGRAYLVLAVDESKKEYYKAKNWKAKKFNGTKYVKYNVIPGMLVSEQSFPDTYESGVIVLYAAVGAYWTPGYV